jgi:hypothetical protein
MPAAFIGVRGILFGSVFVALSCLLLAGCSSEDRYMMQEEKAGPEEIELKSETAEVSPVKVAIDDKVPPPKNVFEPEPWRAPGADPIRDFSAQSNNIADVFYKFNGMITPSIAGHVPEDIQQGIDHARKMAELSTDLRVKPLIVAIANDLQDVADAEKVEKLLRKCGMGVREIAWGAGDKAIEAAIQKGLDMKRGGLSPSLEDRELIEAAMAFERKHGQSPDQVKLRTLTVVQSKLDQFWNVIEQARKEAGKHPIERNPSSSP